MAGKSDFLENNILDHVVGGAAYTAPATLYAALFTVAPTDAGGGTEAVYGAYARVALTPGTDITVTGSTATNPADITWPAGTSGAVTNAVAVGIFDALTAGNLLYWASLAEAIPTGSGITPVIEAGNLDFTED